MSLHVQGHNISHAWVEAYEALSRSKGNEVVNLTVTISDPTTEIFAVRQLVDRQVAELAAAGCAGYGKSVHTVANTIFPISLYTPGNPQAFFDRVRTGQSGRQGTVTSWGPKSGTYIGRLVQYPTYGKGTFNQLARMLANLDMQSNYQDSYELALECEPPDDDDDVPNLFGSASTFVPAYDNNHRGGQCLSHISLNLSRSGELSLTALYRHQTFLTRAYGNFLGLARLQQFLVHESRKDIRCGELMVTASHAEIDAEGRRTKDHLMQACKPQLNNDPSAVEWHTRPFGSSWSDLNLPRLSA